MLGYYDDDIGMEGGEKMIKVIVCEPGKMARVAEIGTGLEELQRAVGGGLIETYYPFEDAVCIVCNDEGKLNGMRPCRAILNDQNKVRDIVFGPFFICDGGGEDFGSLTEDQLERYGKMFEFPENYYRVDGEIKVVPYVPSQTMEQAR